VIGCEDRLQNNLGCVKSGAKLIQLQRLVEKAACFAPVMRLAWNIMSVMTYNLSSGTLLDSTRLTSSAPTCIHCYNVMSGGRVVDGNHGNWNGRRWAAILQRAASTSHETSEGHASTSTEEHS